MMICSRNSAAQEKCWVTEKHLKLNFSFKYSAFNNFTILGDL